MTDPKRMTAEEQAEIVNRLRNSDSWWWLDDSIIPIDEALSAERAHSEKVEAMLLSYYRGGKPHEGVRELLRRGHPHLWMQDQDETNCVHCNKRYSVDVDLAGCLAAPTEKA